MMDCLMATRRFSEAFQLYERTTAMYFAEIGMEPSAAMQERFEKLKNTNQLSRSSLEGIKRRLEEPEEDGPYDCPLPRFIDNFHFIRRILERNGQPACLAVIILEDLKNIPLSPDEARTGKIAQIMGNCIRRTIRRGDMMTQYNAFTYLILLMGAEEDGSRVVEERILKRFREECTYKKVRARFLRRDSGTGIFVLAGKLALCKTKTLCGNRAAAERKMSLPRPAAGSFLVFHQKHFTFCSHFTDL